MVGGNKKLYINNELLTELIIPDSVTSIRAGAFKNCSSLTSVTIPDGVTSIGEYAFSCCSGLTSVTIPDSVTSIGEYAFSGCGNLKYNEYGNALYLGDKNNPYVALIKVKADNITSCVINENCKVISYSAFENCSGLTSVTIGNGVTSIRAKAFGGCSGLTSITIPDSVTSIGSDAFIGCSGLEKIYYNGTMSQWNDIEKAYEWDSLTGNYTIHCTDGTIAK